MIIYAFAVDAAVLSPQNLTFDVSPHNRPNPAGSQLLGIQSALCCHALRSTQALQFRAREPRVKLIDLHVYLLGCYYLSIYIYMYYTYICTYLERYIYIYMYIYIYICADNMYLYQNIYIHIQVNMYIYIYTCAYNMFLYTESNNWKSTKKCL